VFLNVDAQRIETDTGRPVLQWLHASYAAGGVTGAAIGGAIVAVGIDYRVGIAISGLVLFATALWNGLIGSPMRGVRRRPRRSRSPRSAATLPSGSRRS
jgi:hypothetical protein